jgi:hypothetical protein
MDKKIVKEKAVKVMISDEAVEELRQFFVETEHNIRWDMIKMYHEAGRMLEEMKGANLQDIAKRIGRSYRTLRYAITLFKMFPNLDNLPEGKNVSMNQVIRKYLTTPEEKKAHVCTFITICSVCHTPMDLESARKTASVDNG